MCDYEYMLHTSTTTNAATMSLATNFPARSDIEATRRMKSHRSLGSMLPVHVRLVGVCACRECGVVLTRLCALSRARRSSCAPLPRMSLCLKPQPFQGTMQTST